MSSILTNNGAMVALQTLRSINNDLEDTQSQISTGKKVATAKDNAAIWSVSKVMESDAEVFKTVNDQLGSAEAALGTAQKGAEKVTEYLQEMRALAVSAINDGTKAATVQTQMVEKIASIAAVVDASQYNGINLLKTDVNGTGGTQFNVVSSLNRVGGTPATTVDRITVDGVDFEADIEGATITTITDSATAATALADIEGLLDIAVIGTAALGAKASRVSDQREFVSDLADSLKSGVGAMVDANMEEASARLKALQTQQQLGTQSLSIANNAPQSLMALFR